MGFPFVFIVQYIIFISISIITPFSTCIEKKKGGEGKHSTCKINPPLAMFTYHPPSYCNSSHGILFTPATWLFSSYKDLSEFLFYSGAFASLIFLHFLPFPYMKLLHIFINLPLPLKYSFHSSIPSSPSKYGLAMRPEMVYTTPQEWQPIYLKKEKNNISK